MIIISTILGVIRYLVNWSIQPLFLRFHISIQYFTIIIMTTTSLTALFIHQVILHKKIRLNYLLITNILVIINILFTSILVFLKFIANVNTLLAITFVMQRALFQELMTIARSLWQPFIKSSNRATVLSGISFVNTILFASINIIWGRLLDISVYWSTLFSLTFLTLAVFVFTYHRRKLLLQAAAKKT